MWQQDPTHLRLAVPNALQEVRISGSWDNFFAKPRLEFLVEEDLWEIALTIPPGGYTFQLIVDGKQEATTWLHLDLDGNFKVTPIEARATAEIELSDLQNDAAQGGSFFDLPGWVTGYFSSTVPTTPQAGDRERGPLQLSNPVALCYLNSALQILDAMGLDWAKAESPVGKKLSQFLQKGHQEITHMELVEYLSHTLKRNLLHAGDIREVFLMMVADLPEVDVPVWKPLRADLSKRTFCWCCGHDEISPLNATYWFLLQSRKVDLAEKLTEHVKSCPPPPDLKCCSNLGMKSSAILLTSPPMYCIFLTSSQCTLPPVMQLPTASQEAPLYVLQAFSLNSGGHCRAVRREGDEWQLCDDADVSTIASIEEYTSRPALHLLVIYKRIQEGLSLPLPSQQEEEKRNPTKNKKKRAARKKGFII